MKRRARLAFVCLFLASCEGQIKLPTAPSDLTVGIVIYRDENYQGFSSHVTEDIADLDDVEGGCFRLTGGSPPGGTGGGGELHWDDCITSVRIAPGWEAHLYEDPNFEGEDLLVLEDIADLDRVLGPCGDDFDDCASSIRVFPRDGLGATRVLSF